MIKGEDAFCAVRHWEKGDFDIIVFTNYQEMIDFCSFNDDYTEFETSVLSLSEAKSIFSEVV